MTTVLLVEDDRWMGECYLAWLHSFGYNAIWVQSAQAALNALDDNEDVNLIILDIMLPYVNGISLLNILASHADLADIPVVVCSSMGFEGLGKQYGIKAVLNKAELTPRQMQSALSGVLANAAV